MSMPKTGNRMRSTSNIVPPSWRGTCKHYTLGFLHSQLWPWDEKMVERPVPNDVPSVFVWNYSWIHYRSRPLRPCRRSCPRYLMSRVWEIHWDHEGRCRECCHARLYHRAVQTPSQHRVALMWSLRCHRNHLLCKGLHLWPLVNLESQL